MNLLAQLLKDPHIGARIVPIVADEARTFGMHALFRQVAIYSSAGQVYQPEDKDELLYYITVMNENYPHPAMPEGAAAGILKGMYRLQERPGAQVQLLGAGAILREVMAAAQLLETDFGVAASDYVRAVPDLIRPYVPRRYVTLGADGFGRSDTRAALREFFEVSREHIAFAALKALADESAVERSVVRQAARCWRIEAARPAPWET